jgi:serine O-acetyltransferase
MNKFNFFSYIRSDIARSFELKNGQSEKIKLIDFFRIAFSPKFFPVFLIRLSYFFYDNHLIFISKAILFFNFIIFGIEIRSNCSVGKGLFIAHSNGIVIGAKSIGTNFTIFQGVTIGSIELDFSDSGIKRPVIKNNVTIYSGAKVLGAITIDDHSIVGANAVVLKSSPKFSLLVGIPADIRNVNSDKK